MDISRRRFYCSLIRFALLATSRHFIFSYPLINIMMGLTGQPRRHLLQSGWSVFVSSKRLVAGDAFIFLRLVDFLQLGSCLYFFCSSISLSDIGRCLTSRGENGELRVGVRRAMRQQGNVPSSVISSHSMHLGVLATAWHAIMTGTMFTVYYKPRYGLFGSNCFA